MGIEKNHLINADEIVNYLRTKDYSRKKTNEVQGHWGETIEIAEWHFWIRNDPHIYTAPSWDVGTSYASGSKVSFESKVYRAKTATTGDIPDESPAVWKYIYPVTTTWYNVKTRVDFTGRSICAGSHHESDLWIYKVTWDENGTPEYTEKYHTSHIDEFLITLEPGYYKAKSRERLPAATFNCHRWTRILKWKPWNNTFVSNENIRFFNDDYQTLKPTSISLVTPDAARAGKLASTNYPGGEYGGS